MCTRFASFLVSYMIITTQCVTVNVNNGSKIIADSKEELSPLIIDGKLNQIVTIYVPIIKGTKAKYYLTDPRGIERKLQIKYYEKKKRKQTDKKYEKNAASYNFYITVNDLNVNINNKLQTRVRKILLRGLSRDAKRHNSSRERFNRYDTYNVIETEEANAIKNNANFIVLSPEYEFDNNYKLMKNMPKYNKLKSQQGSKSKIENQRDNIIDIQHVSFLEKNADDITNDLSMAIFKELKRTNESIKYSDISEVEAKIKHNNSEAERHRKTEPHKYPRNILNEVIDVLNVSDYDDEIFKKKRKLSPNFSIGPLTEDDHGNWVLSIFYRNGNNWIELYQVITIHITESIPAKPKAIKLQHGDDYILSFSYPIKHLQSCELVSPRSASEKYYERYGLQTDFCGYIIRNVSKTEEGTWCIIGVGKIVYEGKSYLQVDTGDFNFNKMEKFEAL